MLGLTPKGLHPVGNGFGNNLSVLDITCPVSLEGEWLERHSCLERKLQEANLSEAPLSLVAGHAGGRRSTCCLPMKYSSTRLHGVAWGLSTLLDFLHCDYLCLALRP